MIRRSLLWKINMWFYDRLLHWFNQSPNKEMCFVKTETFLAEFHIHSRWGVVLAGVWHLLRARCVRRLQGILQTSRTGSKKMWRSPSTTTSHGPDLEEPRPRLETVAELALMWCSSNSSVRLKVEIILWWMGEKKLPWNLESSKGHLVQDWEPMVNCRRHKTIMRKREDVFKRKNQVKADQLDVEGQKPLGRGDGGRGVKIKSPTNSGVSDLELRYCHVTSSSSSSFSSWSTWLFLHLLRRNPNQFTLAWDQH